MEMAEVSSSIGWLQEDSVPGDIARERQVIGAIFHNPTWYADDAGLSQLSEFLASPAGAVRVCGSTIRGNVQVSDSAGPVVIGYAAVGCAVNSISGSLTLLRNTHGVQVIGNRVGGGVTAVSNSGAGPFPADTVARITGNHT